MLERYTKMYHPREAVELYHAGKRIYGAPMPLPHPKSKLSPSSGDMKGTLAENVVANLLNMVTEEREDVYVFHSIAEENKKGELIGETDHIVLYKRLLILVETKNRPAETLTYSKKGELMATRHGHHYNFNGNNLLQKIKTYKNSYPFLTVEALIVGHYDTKETSSKVDAVKVITINQIINEIVNKIDTFTLKPVDIIPIIKDISTRCIRKEIIH